MPAKWLWGLVHCNTCKWVVWWAIRQHAYVEDHAWTCIINTMHWEEIALAVLKYFFIMYCMM